MQRGQHDKQKETRANAGLGSIGWTRVRLSCGVLLGMVLMAVALVRVVNVLAGVVLVAVALVVVMDMPRLVAVMLVAVTFVDVMNVFAGVVFVLVALVVVVMRSYQFGHLTCY